MSYESGIFKAFPWFQDTTALQNYKKPQCQGECQFKFISPNNGMIPFQIIKTGVYNYATVEIDTSTYIVGGEWFSFRMFGANYDIPGSINITDASGLQAYMNTLGIGTFTVTLLGAILSITIRNSNVAKFESMKVYIAFTTSFVEYPFSRTVLPIIDLKIYCPNGSDCIVIDPAGLFDYWIDKCDKEYITYNGKPLGVTIPCGYHMGIAGDGVSTWYSELFYVPADSTAIAPICYLTDHLYNLITTEDLTEPLEAC